MAWDVYPTGADSGFSEETQLSSEFARKISALGGRMEDFVVDPFTGGDFSLTTSASSFDVDVAAGEAFMGGHFVKSDATVTVTVNASVTSELFLVVDDAETNNVSIVAQDKATADPTGSYVMKLWEVTSDGSGVTGTTDFRYYVAFREAVTEDTITGRKVGTYTGASVDTNGVFTVSVTFTNPYIDAADEVLVSLDTLTDTAVEFGYMRTKNVTTTGFDIEYSIGPSGASGSTADFHWIAHGR